MRVFRQEGLVHAFLIAERLLRLLLFLQRVLGLHLPFGLWIFITHGFGGSIAALRVTIWRRRVLASRWT